ncbi:MAG TPA: hypothetical protein VFE05_20060 [Longimicrobiaceae bacterium]|nr:hypothetical protein [Longimicrobiaceae bacterium]
MRVLAGGLGGLLLLGMVVVTFGGGLVPLLGIGVAAWVASARGRRTGLLGSWIGATASSTAVILASILVVMQQMPGHPVDAMQRATDSSYQARQAARRENRSPKTVEEVLRGDSASAARVHTVVGSKPFMWWTLAMGCAIASTFIGVLAATPVWGALVLFLYGVRGTMPFTPKLDAG